MDGTAAPELARQEESGGRSGSRGRGYQWTEMSYGYIWCGEGRWGLMGGQ